METKELLEECRATGEDHEWYPTTNEIIDCVIRAIKRHRYDRTRMNRPDALDIGAGNGKVLAALRDAEVVGDLYAIEKSKPLLGAMPKDVFVIGTDFEEQTLFDKEAGITFCNPPYSEYVDWVEKIIRETASPLVYLVIPQRWRKADRIKKALEYREAKATALGSYDFESAEDRQARAVVDLVEIEIPTGYGRDDAFTRFFDEEFAHLKERMEPEAEAAEDDPAAEVVGRKDFIVALVELYQREMDNIRGNYGQLGELDAQLLHELEIDIPKIRELLRLRLKGLKKHYWKLVFDNLDKITDRLTSASRKSMLETLFDNTHVDFTLGNAYAVVLWAIRNANDYYESQLIDLYERMVSVANAHNYKSNERVFEWDVWRYHTDDGTQATHYALNYRIVLERCGGIFVSDWGSWEAERYNGLNEHGYNFLQDLATVANNLGFVQPDGPGNFDWESRKLNTFTYTDRETGERRTLMEVRAFQNQNIHVRFAGEFALALNVEFGRLKGWVKNGREAAEELDEPEAPKHFQTLHQVRITDASRMIGSAEPEQPGPAATLTQASLALFD